MNAAVRHPKIFALWRVAVLLSMAWCAAALGQGRDGVRFNVPVLPDAARYIDVLAVPGIAALMLENNGLNPSLSSRLVVKDRTSFSIRSGVVRFSARKHAVFTYEVGFDVASGFGESNLTFTVEVDTSGIANGTVELRLYPPLAKFLPEEILQKIEHKIRAVADLRSQRKLVDYLDRLSKEQQSGGRGFDGVLEAVTLEAYNRSGNASSASAGAAKVDSFVDGAILLGVLAVWLIGFPVFLFFVRRPRKPSE